MKKEKLTSTLLLVFFLAISTLPVLAQNTDADLQNKYWTYRHKLRTEFTKIGKFAGHSIPAENININKVCGEVPGQIQTGDATLNLGEYIAVLATEYRLLLDAKQDVRATANELYYALNAVQRVDEFAEVLFTEDVNNAKGDGFFVRDDWPADMHRQIFANEVDNAGQLISDPIKNYQPYNTLVNFQNAHREEGPVPTNNWETEGIVKVKHPIYNYDIVYNVDKWNGCNISRDGDNRTLRDKKTAEMSQDQLYGLLMGFYAVKKFVPAEAAAQPRPTDQYINFHAWVEVMADRVLTFVSKKKTVKNVVLVLNEDSTYRLAEFSEMETTWFIYNEVAGDEQVLRGTNLWMYSEPLSRIGKEITGKTYDPEIIINFPKLADRVKFFNKTMFLGVYEVGCMSNVAAGAEKHKANETEYKNIQVDFRCITGGNGGIAVSVILLPITVPANFWLAATGKLMLPSSDKFWQVAVWSAVTSENNLASQMTIKLAAMDPEFKNSIILNPDGLVAKLRQFLLSPTSNLPQNADLNTFNETFYKKLGRKRFYNLMPNTFQPQNWQITNKTAQQYFLAGAPCYGIGKTGINQSDASIDSIWMHGDLNSLSKQAEARDKLPREETNGIGYMLYHNFYRLCYKDEITDVYKPSTCPCNSTGLISHRDNNDNALEMGNKLEISTINGIYITPRKYSEYADIGIPKPFYVSHNVDIGNQGNLKVSGDLTVCNSEMRVRFGGQLTIPQISEEYPTEMRVENGGILEVETGGTIRVEGNSKLIIAETGRLKINTSTLIYLDGPDAELIIEGELELADNAVFTVLQSNNGRGVVTFRRSIDLINGNETYARIKPGVNSSIVLRGNADPNRTILKIDGNLGIIVPVGLNFFAVLDGKIQLGSASRLIVECPITVKNVIFDAIRPEATYTAGLITAGQRNVRIEDAIFKNGYYGYVAENYIPPQSQPVVINALFENLIYGIKATGGGINLTDVNFNNNTFNFIGNGLYFNSEFNNVYMNNGKVNFATGSSSGSIGWYKGSVSHNTEDGIITMGIKLSPKCVRFTNNRRYGLYAKQLSTLNISSVSNAGYNNIMGNTKGIFSYNVQGNTSTSWFGDGMNIDLIDGYNFIDQNAHIDLEAVVSSSSIVSSGLRQYVPAGHNYWGGGIPQVGTDYNLTWKPNWGSPVIHPEIETYGTHLTSSNQVLVAQAGGTCFDGMIIPRGPMDGRTPINTPKTVEDLGILHGKNIHQAFNEAAMNHYNDKDYALAMQKFAIIIKEDLSSLNKEDAVYLYQGAYSTYMECLGKVISSDSTELGRQTKTSQAIEVLSYLQSQNNETQYWSSEKLRLGIDMAYLYSSLGNFTSAFGQLDELIYAPDQLANVELVNYHKCILSGQFAVLSGQISISERIEDYPCEIPYSLEEELLNNDALQSNVILNIQTQVPNTLLLSPNPTKGIFEVTLGANTQAAHIAEQGKIVVADGYGYQHIVLENIDAAATTTLNLSGFKAGVYNIRFEIGNTVYYKYLVKTDE